MVSFINRKEVLKYQPLASYLAMLQADMIDDELDFAESEQAKQEIRKRYDAINYHQPGNVPTIEERIFYHPEEALLTYPPVIVIQPAERSYFMHLCKYGNLHFYASPESKDAIPLKALRAAGFREWNGQEFERFDDSGTIAERVTRV